MTNNEARISSEKLALISQLLNEKSNKSQKKHIIKQARDSITYPLSYSQRNLWFLHLLYPESAAYNMIGTIKIEGELDYLILNEAFRYVINRHEILRAYFCVHKGEPMQMINDSCRFSIAQSDMTGATIQSITQHLQKEAGEPFDLGKSPLIRAKLIKQKTNSHVLLIVMHHLISDGWSMDIFIKEIMESYESIIQGKTPDLQQMKIHYIDYVLWQKEWEKSSSYSQQLAYWKKQLDKLPSLLDLPYDYQRPPIQSYQGESLSREISQSLNKDLDLLSHKEDVTLFMTLLAAFQTLLYRYSGQDDIVIGTPIANRNYKEMEPLIGLFANSLVLRSQFNEELTFVELLRKVRETTLKAYENQEVPFEHLVETLNPERSMGYNPIFQIMFSMNNSSSITKDFSNLSISTMQIENKTSKFDLTFNVEKNGPQMAVSIEYDVNLFNQSTIEHLWKSYLTLLQEIVGNPHQLVSKLPLVEKNDYHKMVVGLKGKDRCHKQYKSIIELIESTVAKFPSATALLYDEQSLTYQELNKRANSLANYLRTLGVSADVLVGVFVERSLDMIISLLAILKAGGAYVPIDPTFPEERISWILNDSQISIVLTEEHLIGQLPQSLERLVCVSGKENEFAGHSNQNPDIQIDRDQLAYVIYTSGSTGKPKGVTISHGSLLNFMISAKERPGLSSNDTWLAVTTYSFDISIMEIFLPLTIGAKEVIASHNDASNGQRLMHLLENSKATVLQGTPSMWRMLLDAGLHQVPVGFKALCGGEAMSEELARQMLDIGAEVWNLYGPTETTIWSSMEKIEDPCAITIGTPINNTHMYLLDNKCQFVPTGVKGEIVIGGVGLSKGYLNCPELNEERFIANPHKPEERLYRTGDLGRYNSEGKITYIGRTDSQIKLRGHRIELGEIESILMETGSVKEAVVSLRERKKGDNYLVAHIVPFDSYDSSSKGLEESLRLKLAAKVMDYMIPSYIVFLNKMPLLPNGKIDRNSIQKMKMPSMIQKINTAPRSKIEMEVSHIWSEMLQIEEIDIHDNFFNLGGHSLHATKMIFQLSEKYNYQLPVQEVYRDATIANISKLIERGIQFRKSHNDDNINELLERLTDEQIDIMLQEQLSLQSE